MQDLLIMEVLEAPARLFCTPDNRADLASLAGINICETTEPMIFHPDNYSANPPARRWVVIGRVDLNDILVRYREHRASLIIPRTACGREEVLCSAKTIQSIVSFEVNLAKEAMAKLGYLRIRHLTHSCRKKADSDRRRVAPFRVRLNCRHDGQFFERRVKFRVISAEIRPNRS
jgi:hypothetical protein